MGVLQNRAEERFKVRPSFFVNMPVELAPSKMCAFDIPTMATCPSCEVMQCGLYARCPAVRQCAFWRTPKNLCWYQTELKQVRAQKKTKAQPRCTVKLQNKDKQN